MQLDQTWGQGPGGVLPLHHSSPLTPCYLEVSAGVRLQRNFQGFRNSVMIFLDSLGQIKEFY